MSSTEFYLPDPQDYAAQQERERHDGALYYVGEYCIFILMWRPEDEEAGLVTGCSECTLSDVIARETYKQPGKTHCETCFGSGFEGGYKARIVRPSQWSYGEVSHDLDRRGEVVTNAATIQATSDFRLRTGDYILRGDTTRWKMTQNVMIALHTGFQMATRSRSHVSYSYSEARLEDRSSAGYMIPPTDEAEILALLDVSHPHTPLDFASFEDIRGPLL
jgi:hypothetical protein